MSIDNPLAVVPLNTKRLFVMCRTHCGCEIWMPLRAEGHEYEQMMKKRLQNFLNTQTVPPEFNQPDPAPLLA